MQRNTFRQAALGIPAEIGCPHRDQHCKHRADVKPVHCPRAALVMSDGVAEYEIDCPGDRAEQDPRPELRDAPPFAKLHFERLAHSTLGAKSITRNTTT